MTDEPAAWLLRAKNGMIRAAYTRPCTPQDYEFAQIDGDTITLLYAAPQPELMAAIKVLHKKIRYEDDCGPAGEGWQSDELRAAWAVIDAALSAKDEK